MYAVLSTDTSWDEVPDNEVRKYNAETFTLLSTSGLPDFLFPDGTGDGKFYESQGHHGFFTSEGSEFFVVLKTLNETSVNEKWAIVEMDVD